MSDLEESKRLLGEIIEITKGYGGIFGLGEGKDMPRIKGKSIKALSLLDNMEEEITQLRRIADGQMTCTYCNKWFEPDDPGALYCSDDCFKSDMEPPAEEPEWKCIQCGSLQPAVNERCKDCGQKRPELPEEPRRVWKSRTLTHLSKGGDPPEEPEKEGEWIRGKRGGYECSACGYGQFSNKHSKCKRCGASMEVNLDG